jgi:hypothetical protein
MLVSEVFEACISHGFSAYKLQADIQSTCQAVDVRLYEQRAHSECSRLSEAVV